jgi:hypothetical protein
LNTEIKQFIQLIQQGVDSLSRQAAEKDYMKQLADDAKEKFDIKPADFTARCKAAYDMLTAIERRDKLTDVIDELEGLGFN